MGPNKRFLPMAIAGLLILSAGKVAGSVPTDFPDEGLGCRDSATVVFDHVTVIPMDRPGELSNQTVVVEGGRIRSVGPSESACLPEGAAVLDGSGRYLLPGLTDAHVHLDPMVGARPRFGDGALYLAYGITTVFNLRGGPEDLRTRDLIQKGELLAPNLYTSGEFVNEPRVNTPEEAAAEVASQRKAGYDLVKIHQCIDPETGRYTTTKWMDAATFDAVNDEARREGIPLLGHGPYNLGLGAALEARESLAHIGEFHPLYFVPARNMKEWMLAAAGGLLLLTAVVAGWGLGALVRRFRRLGPQEYPLMMPGLKRWSLLLFFLSVGTAVSWLLLMPGGPLTGRGWMLAAEGTLALGVAVASVGILGGAARAWAEKGTPLPLRAGVSLAAVAAIVLTASALHWVPLSWRARDASIEAVARRCKAAGIWVQSTLVIYDTAFGPGQLQRVRGGDSAARYLAPEVRKEWEGWPGPPAWMVGMLSRYPAYTRKVAGSLHREGVPVMAGTDSMGFPWMVPGESLHRELALLVQSGFSAYEALQTATTAPAKFLGKEGEFGVVAPGARADLLLVDQDPLKDLAVLTRPAGVMVRGRWLTREQLIAELAKLEGEKAGR